MKSNKQAQKSGNGSLNIQAGHDVEIKSGLSYEDAKNIALDVFQANFYKLVGLAQETARQRAEEITEKFLRELQKRSPECLKNAEDVDFQHSLFTAQKEYAKTGDKDLGDILVDILVDRSKEDERSLLQIVLNESLYVVPKLTQEQLAALSVIFTLRYTKYKVMNSLQTLRSYIEQRLSPFVSLLSKKRSTYQHLEYSGCGSISMGQVRIEPIFRNTYPGLFSKGFREEDLKEKELNGANIRKLCTKCLQNNDLLQFNALDEDLLRLAAKTNGLEEDIVNKIISFQKSYLMKLEEVKECLMKVHPCMEKLFDYWDNSDLQHMSLTSVGIAIGHANMRRLTGESSDLGIWI